MDDDKTRPLDGPEALTPADHEKAEKLAEAQQEAREAGPNRRSDADLPKVHGDEG